MVDGINLDEIKEFAKAFKLRRLSLGLTQTQVGQALSVTEGPAYSQSAICRWVDTSKYCFSHFAHCPCSVLSLLCCPLCFLSVSIFVSLNALFVCCHSVSYRLFFLLCLKQDGLHVFPPSHIISLV